MLYFLYIKRLAWNVQLLCRQQTFSSSRGPVGQKAKSIEVLVLIFRLIIVFTGSVYLSIGRAKEKLVFNYCH